MDVVKLHHLISESSPHQHPTNITFIIAHYRGRSRPPRSDPACEQNRATQSFCCSIRLVAFSR
jgi:hypothetical protein